MLRNTLMCPVIHTRVGIRSFHYFCGLLAISCTIIFQILLKMGTNTCWSTVWSDCVTSLIIFPSLRKMISSLFELGLNSSGKGTVSWICSSTNYCDLFIKRKNIFFPHIAIGYSRKEILKLIAVWYMYHRVVYNYKLTKSMWATVYKNKLYICTHQYIFFILVVPFVPCLGLLDGVTVDIIRKPYGRPFAY